MATNERKGRTGALSLPLACASLFAGAALSMLFSQDVSARLFDDVHRGPCGGAPGEHSASTHHPYTPCGLHIEKFSHLLQLAQSLHTSDEAELLQELKQVFGFRDDARSRPILDLLRKLNKLNLRPKQLYGRFVTIVARHASLVDSLQKLRVSNAEAQVLREQAAVALRREERAVNHARLLLTSALEMICKPAGEENDTYCKSDPDATRLFRDLAWLEEGALDFSAAALLYEKAANTRPPDHPGHLEDLSRAARLWSDHGELSGRNGALEKSTRLYRKMLNLTSSSQQPIEWAKLNLNFGSAIQLLGQQGNDVDKLRQAAEAFRTSLQILGQWGQQIDGAIARGELATTLQLLGKLESNVELYREAIKEFRKVLKDLKREHTPLLWATVQNNLGATLWLFSKGTNNPQLMEDAAHAFREALTVLTRERFPRNWALAQDNLGNVYREIGINAADSNSLRLAVRAYRRSLEELTPEFQPTNWAMTQNNLGIALWTLGRTVDQPEFFEEAATALGHALTVYDPNAQPSEWISAKHILGFIRFELALKRQSTSLMEVTVTDLRSALEGAEHQILPPQRAMVQDLLGRVYWVLGVQHQDVARLNQAKLAFDDARSIRINDAKMTGYRDFYDKSISEIEITISNIKEAG